MRAIVISGGGVKGAWACGALQYLLGELATQYQILCGVSVGAINCAFLSMFKFGQEQESAQQLKNIWLILNNDKIYKQHFPFGKIQTIWKKSFYDSSPLHNLLKTGLDLHKIRSCGKIINVGAVSINSGKYKTFDQTSEYFIEAVIASASFPGVFAPVKFDGHYWVDGGVKQLSPIEAAINLGATEIDILITSPEIRDKSFIENPTTIDIISRSLDLSSDKIMSNDVEKLQTYNILAQSGLTDKKLITTNIIRPKFNLIDNFLDFDPIKIREMIKLGYSDAKMLIK